VAILIARRVRPLIALVAVATAAAVVTPTLASAAPHGKPSVTSVQKQLGQLALKNSQLVEKYDRLQVLLQKRQKQARLARVEVHKANLNYRTVHAQFAQVAQAQYESNNLGAAGALLDSSSDNNYLDRLNTLDMVSNHAAQVVEAVGQARDSASGAAKDAAGLVGQVRSQRDALGKQRQVVQRQIIRYQNLLATLSSAQQYAFQRSINPSVSPASVSTMHLTQAGTAAARRAVEFALAQVGKPYVFGAAGPGSYDCSGLTMSAWAHAGVSLPHSAADQYNYGHHVDRADLEPGDLIFFYQPIGHVTIYIGNGLMVSAPTEGQNVSVVPVSSFNYDYTGATRLT
jgi:cell wall-associated NlpC family hydrolase